MADSDGSRKTGILQQVFVAAAIAMLAGGTSPWWWQETKPLLDGAADSSTPAPDTGARPEPARSEPGRP